MQYQIGKKKLYILVGSIVVVFMLLYAIISAQNRSNYLENKLNYVEIEKDSLAIKVNDLEDKIDELESKIDDLESHGGY